MKRIGALFVAVVCVIGCQGGTDDGIDNAAVQKAQAPLIAAAKRAGGDWAKMTDADKKLFLNRTRGNEGAAKSMAAMMAGGVPAGPAKP